ncbi:hypothetical protein H681_23120 [Pseudomonas sp. ATCC 13867]|nr:hypothetical protein H681_23120 [Pseudomonas sp. ATCC 13867]RFQ21412.1 hypothetical protein D0N87_24080 [Pseudomonas sp. ATCC 13867]
MLGVVQPFDIVFPTFLIIRIKRVVQLFLFGCRLFLQACGELFSFFIFLTQRESLCVVRDGGAGIYWLDHLVILGR